MHRSFFIAGYPATTLSQAIIHLFFTLKISKEIRVIPSLSLMLFVARPFIFPRNSDRSNRLQSSSG